MRRNKNKRTVVAGSGREAYTQKLGTQIASGVASKARVAEKLCRKVCYSVLLREGSKMADIGNKGAGVK